MPAASPSSSTSRSPFAGGEQLAVGSEAGEQLAVGSEQLAGGEREGNDYDYEQDYD